MRIERARPWGDGMNGTVRQARRVVEYADVLVDVMIGYACNVQCDYCSITNEMRKRTWRRHPVMAALADGGPAWRHKVSFGGRGADHPAELLPLVRWCRDRGTVPSRSRRTG